MQTAVELLMIDLYEKGYLRGDGSKLDGLFEKYKGMEKQQHGETWDGALFQNDKRGYNIARTYEDFDDYFAETYGSKGSDEVKGIGSKDINGNEMIFDQELFNYFSQEFNINLLGTEIQDIIDIVKRYTSSQTEISDEEINKEAKRLYDNSDKEYYAFFMGAIFYREQLKSKK